MLPPFRAPQLQTSELSETRDMVLRPMLDTHVFAKVVQDAGAVRLDE